MNKLYKIIAIVALIFVGGLVRAHFDKSIHSPIYFAMFDSDGSELKLRRELMKQRIKRNVLKQMERANEKVSQEN